MWGPFPFISEVCVGDGETGLSSSVTQIRLLGEGKFLKQYREECRVEMVD